MVRHHAHRHVRLPFRAIAHPAQPRHLVDNRRKHIRVIIRRLSLHRHAQTLETHPCVHMVVRQVLQTTVRLPVELHEHQVPDFYHQRIIPVHQLPPRFQRPFRIRSQIDVNLGTRTAGTHIPHLPEIILLIAVQNPFLRQIIQPNPACLLIPRQPVVGTSLEHRGIQPLLLQPHLHSQKFPGILNGMLLEIIPERPVAQHLEHRMMIRVVPHLLQVIVLSRHPQALLRIRHPPTLRRNIAQNHILELIHPRVRKHQRRIILHHHRRRRHNRMPFTLKKVQKLLSDFS